MCYGYGQQFSKEHQYKGVKALRVEVLRKDFETFKMGCGDRRIPLTLRAVIWLRTRSWSCEAESCEPFDEVARLIDLSQDTRN